jgi:hypothetical protein
VFGGFGTFGGVNMTSHQTKVVVNKLTGDR